MVFDRSQPEETPYPFDGQEALTDALHGKFPERFTLARYIAPYPGAILDGDDGSRPNLNLGNNIGTENRNGHAAQPLGAVRPAGQPASLS